VTKLARLSARIKCGYANATIRLLIIQWQFFDQAGVRCSMERDYSPIHAPHYRKLTEIRRSAPEEQPARMTKVQLDRMPPGRRS
jgi:hypothetical protein